MKTLKDFDLVGKRVLVRCDLNVPTDKNNNILDDFKIRETLPTIKYLIHKRSKIILMSHLDPESTGVADKKYTLNNVAKKLSHYLGFPVAKADDCIGPEIESHTHSLEMGGVMLLENLKFHKEEKAGDAEFAKKLSYLGEIYADDAFGTCYRPYASIVAITEYMPSCMGLLLEKEITNLNKISQNPEKPLIALIGGKKVETKVKVIDKLSERADFILISGLIKNEAEKEKIIFKYPEKIFGR